MFLTQLMAVAVLLALSLSRHAPVLEPLHFFVTLGPRVAFAVPFLVLLPWAFYERYRWLIAEQVFLLILIFGPLMGLHVKGLWADRQVPAGGGSRVVRVVSFNIGPYGLNIDDLIKYLKARHADVLLIQEDTNLWLLKSRMDAETGWYSNRRNTIYSRFPIVAESAELPDEFGGEKLYASHLDMARISNGELDFLVGTAHGPSLRSTFHNYLDHIDLKELSMSLKWQKRQIERIAAMMDASDQRPMIVGGDFNIPPGSIYSQPLDKRFADVFPEVGTGYGFTFPTRFRWLRLDRFYVTRDWQPLSFQVLPEMGSDHRPIMTELYLRQSK